LSNNTASKTTTVVTSADLSVTNTDGVTSVSPLGGKHTYTIVVTNAGPSPASDVTLVDYWPSGFARGAVTTSQGTCVQGSGYFDCGLGNLAPGASVTVKADYTVPVTSLLAGPQTNTVTVNSNTPDPNTGNNSASKTTGIGLL
jgi:uncharacterized repeat protein (TIGR01451 family)